MPLYQLSLIVRPLAKIDLVTAVKACCSRMIEDGAVISNLESLGYRDLPFKMRAVTGQKKTVTGSYFLMDVYAPEPTMKGWFPFLVQNSEVLHYHFYKVVPEQAAQECTLFEELKPPAYRKSIQDLRNNKRMDQLTRWIAVLNARNLAKREPQSYFVAPFRE